MSTGQEPQQLTYEEVGQRYWKEKREKEERTAQKVKIGFMVFVVVDSIILVVGLLGYLMYTEVVIDPSEVFRVLLAVSAISLVFGIIGYLAWRGYCTDVQKYGGW